MKITVYTKNRSTPVSESVLAWIRKDLCEPEEWNEQHQDCTIAAREGFPLHTILARSGMRFQNNKEHSHFDTLDHAVAAVYAAAGEGGDEDGEGA